MRKFIIYLFLLSLFAGSALAQTNQDSTTSKDSLGVKTVIAAQDSPVKLLAPKKHKPRPQKDSTVSLAVDSLALAGSLALSAVNNPSESLRDSQLVSTQISYNPNIVALSKSLLDNSFYNFLAEPLKEKDEIHKEQSYDGIFYLLLGVLFYFAMIKTFFAKYLSNLFNLFFRVSMRQQQIREQVLQTPLPSLFMNAQFFVVSSLYSSFLARYYQVRTSGDIGILFVKFLILISLIYSVKFLLLKSVGWIFNIQRATDTYIFIVFLTNKMLAIFLLPFLIMLSFSAPLLNDIAVTLSLILVAFFFIYRCFACYGPLRKEIKMNGFHFFLYICAFEIMPLLLIYRMLLTYLEKAY